MKLKYYLRGLGVGIICTAVIMGIALSGKEKEKLTDAEIIERARLLGMVMEEEQEEEPDNMEDDMEDDLEDSDNQNPQTQDGVSDNNQESQEPSTQGEETNVPEETANPEASGETPVTEPEIKVIEVLPGEYSDVVSQKLFEAGLIPDAAAFNKYLMDSGQDQNIMVGAHQIPVGASQDEIIKILGEKPEKTE